MLSRRTNLYPPSNKNSIRYLILLLYVWSYNGIFTIFFFLRYIWLLFNNPHIKLFYIKWLSAKIGAVVSQAPWIQNVWLQLNILENYINMYMEVKISRRKIEIYNLNLFTYNYLIINVFLYYMSVVNRLTFIYPCLRRLDMTIWYKYVCIFIN